MRVMLPVLAGLLALPATATAGPPPHRLDRAAAGFWTAARIRQALGSDSMTHRDVPATATGAGLSSLRVFEASALEDRTNGRVFGVDPREGPYSCSGTSLRTPSESIVLTAGHCVLDNGSWGRDVVFVPAFDHEERPFGIFRATRAFVTPWWRRTGNSDFDVAALRVEPNFLGSLGVVVGAKGWTSGRSRHAKLQIFGYPAAALEGEELRSCAGRGLGSDKLTNGLPGPPTLPARCDMAGGSSGGAWLVDGGTLIDGVTSYGYTANHNRLYSPYFGPAVAHFLSQLP
ncbi:MAG TPA: trypsin-like serine protease [Solirubrobacterales bacterium]|jgi:V8-like Glu-specific endopeptidase|nr:trypsin-like serine protease [Solirubrobacterales bacterium]